ncbi:addiction module antidote protein, HigA family [Salinicola socius]|uniref:Addiction module antidote protein, HigA family n=1 Tax=Salinicola socius TaxID=404433 RepID=A0A1Q8SVR6_9GAMM|nr:addiction module antidote protein, HigA family [Salinicola socius]
MMFNPVHPGEILREEVIESLGLTVDESARRLGVDSQLLSDITNCQTSISADIAWRLELAGLTTAEHWLAMQQNHDLWQLRQRERPAVERLMVDGNS